VTAAAAGGLAGIVVGTWGYSTLAWAAAALVVALVVAAFGAAGERDLTKP
jgi:hypothetical protein